MILTCRTTEIRQGLGIVAVRSKRAASCFSASASPIRARAVFDQGPSLDDFVSFANTVTDALCGSDQEGFAGRDSGQEMSQNASSSDRFDQRHCPGIGLEEFAVQIIRCRITPESRRRRL